MLSVSPSVARTLVGITISIILMSHSGSAQEPAKGNKPASLPQEVSRVLADHGLRIVGSYLMHDLDAQVTKEVKELPKFKKSLMLADRERYAAEAEAEGIKQQVSELRKRHTLLSAQLANVTDVLTNNRLVGELNTTTGLINTLGEQQTQAAEKAKTARGKVHQIQEEFVQAVLALRQTCDEAHQKWESLTSNAKIVDAVETAATQTGQKLALKPSPTLVLAETQLKKYEDAVISEAIPLDNRDGNLWVDVAINGNAAEKMVVDSGASALSMSSDFAKKLKIEPKPTDPDVMVKLADGRQIPSKLVKLDSVRVGKFTADQVECVVLSELAVEAPPLLGMSFLGQYKFEVDAARSELKMVKVDSGEPEPASKKTKKKAK